MNLNFTVNSLNMKYNKTTISRQMRWDHLPQDNDILQQDNNKTTISSQMRWDHLYQDNEYG